MKLATAWDHAQTLGTTHATLTDANPAIAQTYAIRSVEPDVKTTLNVLMNMGRGGIVALIVSVWKV